jgi:thymidylate synthase ThyX
VKGTSEDHVASITNLGGANKELSVKKTLDSGTKLMVVDDLNPEDAAMLQALYSRSADSAEVHLAKVQKSGSGRFMENYVVGFGHKSIADCGTTTLFVEGVSLLAAKAIQDWPLYAGQETSTRYIDMGKQRIVDPVGTPESRAILDAWMDFYSSNQGRVSEILIQRYPKHAGEKDETYARAIKARTFDVLRGFLPAGLTTQLSWHTNLRQAGDHLVSLVNHPSAEIVDMARALQALLAERYPSSGFDRHVATVSGVGAKEGRAARAAWEAVVGRQFTYNVALTQSDDSVFLASRPQFGSLDAYAEILKTRPRGCVLPHFLSDLGQYTFAFTLDFGSFRDLQRHRNGVCRMPLLDMSYGFHPWYLEQIGDPANGDVGGLRDAAVDLIYDLRPRIDKISPDPVVRSYYTALGFRVPCQVTYALPALIYVMELRSGKTVHPTLRQSIHAMARLFRRNHPDIALHVDMDPDDWDVRRGDQTITNKQGSLT